MAVAVATAPKVADGPYRRVWIYGPLLDSCAYLLVNDEGRLLPVIDHWVRKQESGSMMTQLHLVVAGR